jgi:c-di-GMP-binding flagellar brake protein YcgR
MRKHSTICFRTSNEIRKALESISVSERKSLSSIIETILFQHLKDRKTLQAVGSERRRYTRKKVSLPALIREASTEYREYQAGTIIDISLGGLKIAVPKGTTIEITTDEQTKAIEVAFALPDATHLLRMKCQPRRANDAITDFQIGASIEDADFNSYKVLQQYLM